MTKEELDFIGFKKKGNKRYYWYEIRHHEHLFITNDSMYNEGKDEWIVGYDNKKDKDSQTFWFNKSIDSMSKVIDLFPILTECNLGINGVISPTKKYKLFRKK